MCVIYELCPFLAPKTQAVGKVPRTRNVERISVDLLFFYIDRCCGY
jgi:hypothetical protein